MEKTGNTPLLAASVEDLEGKANSILHQRRLKDYLKEKSFEPDERIFPICYEAARAMVKKAWDVVGVKLRPHDLRRHAATHASDPGFRWRS